MNAKRKEYMHEVVPFFMPGHLGKAHNTSQTMSFSAGSNRTFDTSEARCTIISPSLNQMVLIHERWRERLYNSIKLPFFPLGQL